MQINKTACIKETITCIWNNKDFKIDNKTIVFGTWFDKRVKTLKDLLNPNLDFLTCEEFKPCYQLQTNFFNLFKKIK